MEAPKNCPTWSNKNSRQRPRIVVQSKDMSMAVVCSMVATETRKHLATQQAAKNLPWIGVDDSSWVGPRISLELTTHVTLCKKMEAWWTSGTLMKVTCSAIRSWCRPTFMNLMTPTTKLEQSELRRKHVIDNAAGLDTAPPEWKIVEVRSESLPLSGTPPVHRGPTLGQGRCYSCSAVPGSLDRNCAPLRESLGVSRTNHILRVHGHATLQEKRADEIYDEVGQRSLERLFPGFMEESMVQATPTRSAGQSRIGYKRVRDIAGPAHIGALMARILAMTQDAVTTGFLPLEAALDEVIGAATTTTYLEALENEDKPLPSYTFRKQSRQRTKHGTKQLRGTTGPPSRTRQCQRLSRAAQPG